MHGVLSNKMRYRSTNEYLYKTLPLILYSHGISDNTQLFTTCINTTVIINITSIMARRVSNTNYNISKYKIGNL